jgi:hypothetical protein
MLGAANRDPARYEHPDRIDVTRDDIRPLTFGGGVHFCLGAALARVEIEVVFRRLLERFTHIELAGSPEHTDRLTLRGPVALPITVSAEGEPVVIPPITVSLPAPVGVSGDGRVGLGALPARPRDDTAWRAVYRSQVERAGGVSPDELTARIGLLGRVPLFRSCSATELESLARTAYPLVFDPGDVLCVEGADAPECYVIAEGEAAVTIGGEHVTSVGEDDVVGERGPIAGAPRAATVVAATHMVTYAISRARLGDLLAANPALADAMRADVARRYG